MRASAFSLLEAMIALAIFIVLGSSFLLLSSLSRQSYKLQAEISGLQQNLWIVSKLLESDLPATGYLGLPDSLGQVATWPVSTSTVSFVAGSGTVSDVLTLRQRMDTPNTFQGVTYQLDASGGLNRVSCQLVGAPCTPGSASANTVAISPLEAFEVSFLSTTGWQSSLPLAKNLRALGIYIRVRSNLPVGPTTCRTYPSTDADLPATAANLGIIQSVPQGQSCRYMRQERFLVISLLNAQVY